MKLAGLPLARTTASLPLNPITQNERKKMQPKTETTTVVRAQPAPARGPVTLPKVIKSRVNQLSHKRAVLYEQTQCAAITAQLQLLADQGATLVELLAVIGHVEAQDKE